MDVHATVRAAWGRHQLDRPDDFWEVVLGSGYRGTIELLTADQRDALRDRLPGDLKQVDAWWLEKTEFFSTTAPEPGWYALFAVHDEEDRELERLPIIAWRGTPNQYGGSAIIIAWDGCGTARPQDAFAYAARPENIDLVGFFHPERFPEPSDIAGYLKQLRGDYLAREQRGKESTTTAASKVTRSAV